RLAEVVGVVRGVVGPGDDGAGVRVHHQHAAALGLVEGDAGGQRLLRGVLDVRVDGQLQVGAVDGVVAGLAADDDLVPGQVLVAGDRPVPARQQRLVEGFHAVLPGAVVVDEAEQVGRQGRVGVTARQVGALAFGLQPDPRQVERLEAVGDLLRLPAGDVGELGTGGDQRLHGRQRLAGGGAQRRGDVLALGGADLVGRDHDRVDGL